MELEARVASLEEENRRLREDNRRLFEIVDQMNTTLNRMMRRFILAEKTEG